MGWSPLAMASRTSLAVAASRPQAAASNFADAAEQYVVALYASEVAVGLGTPSWAASGSFSQASDDCTSLP